MPKPQNETAKAQDQQESYSREWSSRLSTRSPTASLCVNPICFAASIFILCICRKVQSQTTHTGKGGGMESEITLHS